jgi:3-phenylpropionate/trans-cinnamate dioxygenase ferredoxin subunit
VAEVEVCALDELPPGTVRIVRADGRNIGVYNCAGSLYALEDRCSHDDGPLCEGDWWPDQCVVACPRHGARFDIRTGAALTLPAYIPVDTFRARVRDDGMIVLDLPLG